MPTTPPSRDSASVTPRTDEAGGQHANTPCRDSVDAVCTSACGAVPSASSHATESTLRSLRSILLREEVEVEDCYPEPDPQVDNFPGLMAQFSDDFETYHAHRRFWYRSVRFMCFSAAHIFNLVLRCICIAIYANRQNWNIAFLQIWFELIGSTLSILVTFQDADVKKCLRGRPGCVQMICRAVAFVSLGCCQGIYVKRMWARQLHIAEVIQSVDCGDFVLPRPSMGAEHTMPLALVTGVPYAILTTYASTGHAYGWWGDLPGKLFSLTSHEEGVLLAIATFMALMAVGFAVVDVDISVSAKVTAGFHSALRRHSTGVERRFCLYPLVHVIYRVTEIFLRIAAIVGLVALVGEYSNGAGKFAALSLVAIDFTLGVAILSLYSPQEERAVVHGLVGVAIVLCNVARFIDCPGFRTPARKISHAIETFRFLQLFVFVVACNMDLHIFANAAPWSNGRRVLFIIFLVSGVVHYGLGCTLFLNARGDDLHSAVEKGDIDTVKKLLSMGSGGEGLDPNARTRDAAQETPLMLAAAAGEIQALKLLVGVGASVNIRDSAGETCIHKAVRHMQFEALDFLMKQRGAREVMRKDVVSIRRLAMMAQGRVPQDRHEQLVALLSPTHSNMDLPTPARPSSNLTSVRAGVCRNRHLMRLFPDVSAVESFSLSELPSVSALVLANAAGSLARRFLAPYPVSNLIQSLRRVRTLGHGACGEVIEVEVVDPRVRSMSALSNSFLRLDQPSSAASLHPSWRARWRWTSDATGPVVRRCAMKLQAKSQMRASSIACSEVVALRRAVHPFIVKLEEAFQTPQYFALLLELCPRGDLNRLLCSTVDADGRCQGIALQLVARYGGQVLLALVHLHEVLGIIYRDVKPENVLLSERDEAKLSDFGLALYVGRGASQTSLRPSGTIGFIAPELFLGTDTFVEATGSGPTPRRLTSSQRIVSSDGARFAFRTRSSSCRSRSSTTGGATAAAAGNQPHQSLGHAEGLVDPFKTDAYSFGMTLDMMLLGDAVAERYRTESDDSLFLREQESAMHTVMSPKSMTEAERVVLYKTLGAQGRLPTAASDLLLSLLAHKPRSRRRLGEPAVLRHDFFLTALNCTDLATHLLPPQLPNTPSSCPPLHRSASPRGISSSGMPVCPASR